MAEVRDRLVRTVDVAAIYERRLLSGNIRFRADVPERRTETPIRLEATRGRGGFGAPRLGNGRLRILHGSPAALGRENTQRVVGSRRQGVRGRGSNSVLPSWYPRTPLRDITHIIRVKAIDRRNARLRESVGREIDSPITQDPIAHDPSTLASDAQLEHVLRPIPHDPIAHDHFTLASDARPEHDSFKTPMPVPRTKKSIQSIGKVPKILLNIANKENGESDFLTPQKKLLMSIEKVEKAVMEELNKLKRTPIAKRAEREKRSRILLSMR